jgi:hypothetical protein
MEDQVGQAALAMMSPSTDTTTRRQASQFLEDWTQTPEAWEVYAKWLHSYRILLENPANDSNGNGNAKRTQTPDHQIAMQLLCLTMLQTKIRKELPRQQPNAWHPHVPHVRQELWEYLRQPSLSLDPSLIMPCCICNAAIIVRCGLLPEFVTHANVNASASANNGGNQELSPEASLRLLACIPSEMESCQDLTAQQVTEQLVPHLEPVLDTIRRGLVEPSTVLQACQALKEWATISHISLSQLNTPTCGGPHAVLPTLISLLSSNSCQDEWLLQTAAQAVTAAILVPTDYGTPTREAAAAALWNAIPHGFVVAPLHLATRNEWNDACHALATLICTLVNEQIDDLVAQPANVGLQLLLEIQSHPHTPVALIPLDSWLTIQEISLNDRHEHWKRPLYRKVAETLLSRMAYPTNFTDWENELELDSSEFQEFRRMVTDVLVSCYFLLRVELIQLFTHQIRTATHWTASEAALTCLTAISRDVCGRCKAHGGTAIARDREDTCHELLQLLDQLMKVNIHHQHPVLLGAIVNFCGSYSPAWNSMDCPPQAILQLLQYLQSAFAALPLESAKATRAIYVSCLAKTMPNLEDLQNHSNTNNNHSASILPLVLKSVRDSMEAALSTTDEEAMTTVAEGAIRLVTKLNDPAMARQALVNDLLHPVVQRGLATMQAFPESKNPDDWLAPQVQLAVKSLVSYLSVLQVVVRFCDAPHIPNMREWLLQEVGPFLEMAQRQTASSPALVAILPKWIAIHQQLLRNTTPQQSMMMAIFSNTIPLVVQALEQTQDPSTLKYMSAAVETFGGHSAEMDHSFQELLSHVTTVVTSQNNLSDATELLQAYFECLQRYILYCPTALCYNPQFATIITLAVESITALQGAKESTRAALLFLSQLFGWNSLRLSQHAHQILQEAWNRVIKDMLTHHGLTLTQACVVGLAGGPQMLWPAYSDCLFAIVQAAALSQHVEGSNSAEPSSSLNEAMIQHWLYTSMSAAVSSSKSTMTAETCNEVISILLNLARQGPKSRTNAKMLLSDFAKITKGEMAPNALASYALS